MAAPLIVMSFLASATVVGLVGVRLARAGDIIAARTRLGGMWVGSVFLALATSLPNLSTDIAAIRLGAPDLAVGDEFGSNMATMLILALVNLLPGSEVFRRAALDNGLAAAHAIVLMAIAAVLVLLGRQAVVLGMGVGSLILGAAYVVGIRVLFSYSATARAATAEAETIAEEKGAPPVVAADPALPSLRRASMRLLSAALVLLVAAPLFASSATALGELTGLDTGFVGTWLVGLATSLPELVTSITAVRMRAYDLAVGNLFGSNTASMLVLVVLDIIYPGGAMLDAVNPAHAISALMAIALMALGYAAILFRAKGRFSLLEPSSGLLLIVYIVGLWLVYLGGAES